MAEERRKPQTLIEASEEFRAACLELMAPFIALPTRILDALTWLLLKLTKQG